MLDIYFLSGKINSLEKKFIDGEKLKKIVESKTFEEFVNILEGSFFKIPSNLSSTDEIFKIFENERLKLIEEINKINDEKIIIFFLLKYDYYNLSLLVENKDDFSPYGILNFYILKYAFEKNDFSKIPEVLQEGFAICKSKISLEEKLISLKNSYFEKIYCIANEISEFTRNYIKIEIDFANIQNYLNKKLNEKKIYIDDFIKKGFIKRENFLDDAGLWEAISLKYKKIEIPLNEETVERERYKVLIEYLKEGRVKPYGIDKIISFYKAREIEIENLQKLTISKFYRESEVFLKKIIIPPYQYREGK
ncbi:MAG TPA: V-type ATPase subunit [bacterium]|nr:V-type ATPase subunit [bacterium]